MQFITTSDTTEGTHALAKKIISFLDGNTKVLWLISGGSNIPITAEALKEIRAAVSVQVLNNLTIAFNDERYGPVGHPDSNWKQLQHTGVDLTGIKIYSILNNLPLEETVTQYGITIQKILKTADVIVGQFGIGADGHIAGILPHSPAVSENTLPTCGYVAKPFTRISLTFPILRKINIAYMFAAMATKKEALNNLREDGIPFDDQPAQILKDIPEVYVYVD